MEVSTLLSHPLGAQSSQGVSSPQELRASFISVRESNHPKDLNPMAHRRWKMLKEEEKAMWDCLFQMWSEVQLMKDSSSLTVPNSSSKRVPSGKRSDG